MTLWPHEFVKAKQTLPFFAELQITRDQLSVPRLETLVGMIIPCLGVMLSACNGISRQTPHLLTTSISTVKPSSGISSETSIAEPNAPVRLQTLAKLSRKELVTRFGQPDFMRKDPPAEIWQYRSTHCVLDVFLYPEPDDLHVAHAVTRDPSSMRTGNVSCSPFSSGERVAAAS